jgi:ABC-type dipeptide/oligopeptide/nickel transport system permease component
VAGDGVYNEHLMRDYGALNLALGTVALCAVIWATRELFIATAIMQIAYAVPHIIYHLANPEKVGDTTDQFGAIGGLSMGVVLAVLLLFYERKPASATPASP